MPMCKVVKPIAVKPVQQGTATVSHAAWPGVSAARRQILYPVTRRSLCSLVIALI